MVRDVASAGVVYQDVEVAEMLQRGLHDGDTISFLRYIGSFVEASAAEPIDLARDVGEVAFSARADRDIGAFSRIRERDRPADSFSTAGDQRDFVLQPHRISPQKSFELEFAPDRYYKG